MERSVACTVKHNTTKSTCSFGFLALGLNLKTTPILLRPIMGAQIRHFQPCQREWVIRIPDRYVSNGAVARKTMELGEMNLEVELEDEDQECIHH
uniref:Bm10976 n=1 Tax=Brugia malayi TaxID=6279 RepID=A0A0J9Y2C5_BRUMA|nr:Bm10976 [Brugia malayi]